MMSSKSTSATKSNVRSDSNPRPTVQLDWEMEEIILHFESAWLEKGFAEISDFLPAPGYDRFDMLAMELMRVDAELATRAGCARNLNFYTELLPQVLAVESNRQQLAFELSRLSGSVSNETDYPQVGDVLAGFELLSLLGFGAFSRVYLAAENALSRRLVILKFSTKFPGEAGTLARLQHKNIVPIYSWHRVEKFHVVCMPYLGTTTLWDFLKGHHRTRPQSNAGSKSPELGQAIISTVHLRRCETMSDIATAQPSTSVEATAPLDSVAPISSDVPGVVPLAKTPIAPSPVDSPSLAGEALRMVGLSREIPKLLESQHSAETIAWIGKELAEALMHAHDRGVLHRDIKPANILLADDGTPMLLDFNLSVQSTLNDVNKEELRGVGGTPRYMAPEQLLSITDSSVVIDVQSDLYSLGVVLFELAVGRAPFEESYEDWELSIPLMLENRRNWSPQSVKWPSHLSPSVIEIISKLLAFDRDERYASSRALYDDLDRQLLHLPLKHARNRSWRERIQKWSARHPRLSSAATVSVALGSLLLVATVLLVWRNSELRELASAQWLSKLEKVQLPAQAILGQASLPIDQIEEMLQSTDTLVSDPLQSHTLSVSLKGSERDRAKQLLGQLVSFRARGKYRLAEHARDPAQRNAFLESALRDTQQAPQFLTAGKEANEQLANSIRELLMPTISETTDPLTPTAPEMLEETQWLLGVDAANPWYWWVIGYKQFVSGDTESALASARVAGRLDANFPWSHYLTALIDLEARRFEQAEVEFTKLINEYQLDSTELFMNRAIARLSLGRALEAQQDLQKIAAEADRFPRIYFLREQAARSLGDRESAEAELKRGISAVPSEGHGYIARADAKLRTRPQDVAGALSDFARASEMLPHNASCYENQAYILSELTHDYTRAVEVLTRGIERLPKRASLFAARATLNGRQKKIDAAREDIETALALERSAIICYQSASALLLASENPNDRIRALALLKESLRMEPALKETMKQDRDLHSIRDDENFRAALNAAAFLQ